MGNFATTYDSARWRGCWSPRCSRVPWRSTGSGRAQHTNEFGDPARARAADV